MTTLEKAIETYGKDMQLNVAIEELSELIKEICKHKRGSENRDAIIEEMADVNIMLSQLQIIFNIRTGEIASKVIEKMERLEKRLERSENGT
jgi:NTP pyrophosphatase (non-canonical NTP hydrolase)